MDRVSLRYIINPLDEQETAEMIYFRLKKAGFSGHRDIFSYEAIKKIYALTQGYPRKITQYCHNALERLVMEGREVVTGELIDSLAEEEKLWGVDG